MGERWRCVEGGCGVKVDPKVISLEILCQIARKISYQIIPRINPSLCPNAKRPPRALTIRLSAAMCN